MHGIVSLLSEPHYSKVEQLWRELELDCGLQDIKLTPIPHFSWQVARDYDLDLLRPVLKDIAAVARPFRVRTAGLGMFSGPKPVVFINVVKTDEMLHLHKLVWESTRQCAHDISPYYAPQSWIPHITLAHNDLPWPAMSCAIQKLVFQTFDWEILVSSISVISQAEGLVGEESLYYDFSAPAGW
jgi:2'-5' RNA ligase